MTNLERYSKSCEALAKDFIKYLFDREPDMGRLGYDSWVGDEIGGILCVNEDLYFGMGDIVDILTNQYSREDIFDHYDYMIESAGYEKEYGISLKKFSQLRKGMTIDEFTAFYHRKLDDQKVYRASPAGKAEEEKQMEKLKEKYLKDLEKLS